MNITRNALLALGLTIGALACEGETMTVGDEPASGTNSSGFKAGQIWTGYVENFRFPSGSDRVSIAFTSPTTGFVTLGEPPTGAEVIDPDVGYPATLYNPRNFDFALRNHAERFAFTLREGVREGARLRFSIDVREMLKPWCAAQTSYPLESSDGHIWYKCLPSTGPTYIGDDGCRNGDDPVDCGKLKMCHYYEICTCTATSCEVPPGEDLVQFDMRVNGAAAEGSSDLGRIHLEKQ